MNVVIVESITKERNIKGLEKLCNQVIKSSRMNPTIIEEIINDTSLDTNVFMLFLLAL